MKYLIIALALLCSISCSENMEKKKTESTPVAIQFNFDWLTGNWKRTNNSEGKETFEHWERKSNEEYTGLGYTLQQQDTVFKEELRLVKINGTWNLEVSGVNEQPTLFYFTHQTQQSFVGENEKNEFPKKIEYVLEDKKIKATVSGGGSEILFYFEKIL